MSDGGDDHQEDEKKERRKKKPEMLLYRDNIIRATNRKREVKGPSPLAMLQEVFEETSDRDRFVGDTMFWKYFEDIAIHRIYHTNSVEYRNLRVMFWETFFYFFVLMFFMFYTYNLQSQNVYQSRFAQKQYWGGCDALDMCRIHEVNDVASFWNWMTTDLMSLAFTDQGASPQQVAELVTTFPQNQFPITYTPRFVGAKQDNILLGTMRMRQVRVEKNKGCQNSKLIGHVFKDCYPSYSGNVESEESYASRFAPTYLVPAFAWSDSEKTLQLPLIGDLATYGRTGFMMDLPDNNTDTLTMLNDLWRWRWLDRSTRAIIVELSTLNINVNVVVNTKILFEFGPTGTVASSVKSQAAQVHFFTPSMKAGTEVRVLFLQIFLDILFFFYTLMTLTLMYKTCVNFIGQNPFKYMQRLTWSGRVGFIFQTLIHYFGYGWNLCDLAILSLYFTHQYFRIAAYWGITQQPTLGPEVIGHPEYFMPFSWVMGQLTYGNNVLSMLAIAMWVKPFKYLCMIGYFRMLARIMEQCVTKLATFSVMLVLVIFGFAMAFFVGFGTFDEMYAAPAGSFLVLFFLLLDGYSINERWFDAGKSALMPMVFFVYIVVIYFVLLNIFVAVVLDVYATSTENKFVCAKPVSEKNPMAVFIETYYNWKKGILLVREKSEQNMRSEDLSIRLELLPGLVRRKWIEKKRKMQRIASECFAGLELFPGEESLRERSSQSAISDWALPSSRLELAKMQNPSDAKVVSVYDIPPAQLQQEVSRSQLQRLMDEDETLPLLLGDKTAVAVIQRFKKNNPESHGNPEATLHEFPNTVNAGKVKGLQGQVFSRIDNLETIPPDEQVPEVPEISDLTEALSGVITEVRNQFRLQLTSIIEATAMLFEHLVDLTQGIDAVRANHEEVLALVKENMQDIDDED
jgi:hypothetical protein